MREIRFRAWDNNNKIMIYNPKFLSPAKNGNVAVQTLDCCILPECEDKVGCEHLRYETEDYLDGGLYDYPATLMQFTGLKDKNGKEIYGDIVKRIYGDISIVKYLQSSFMFINTNRKKLDDYPNHNLAGNTEVIGNIYENPDLLNI